MPVGDAELQEAWSQVLDRFPFPDYIKADRNHIEVGRQVARFLPPGSRVLDLGAGPADLDSWGDADETIEAYEDLGFDVVERVQGWELVL